MRRLILITENQSGYRTSRFKDEATKKGYEVVMLDMDKIIIRDDALYYQEKQLKIVDKDIVWCYPNTTGSYYLLHYLTRLVKKDKLEVFVWPTLEATLFSDKFMGNEFLSGIGVPTPKTMLLTAYDMSPGALDYVGGFPCVIKKNSGAEGKYVEIARSREDISKITNEFFALTGKSKYPYNKISYILQQYIEESKGSDYRVLCVRDTIIGAIQRTAQSGFKANVSLGGVAKSIEINKKLATVCKKIMRKAKLFHAGIDFIKSKDGFLAIEVNICPQFTGFEKATQINVAEKIIEALPK